MVRYMRRLLILNGLITSAVAIAVAPTATVADIQPRLVRRTDAIPTLFLGDLRQYIAEPKKPGITEGKAVDNDNDEEPPRKGDVTIDPPGFHEIMPDDGITVAFGEDLAKDISSIVADKCKDQDNLQGCIDDVVRVLQGSNLSAHQKRFLPLLAFGTAVVAIRVAAFAAAVAVISVGIAMITSKESPAKVKFEGAEDGVLEQIHAITDATAVAIATGIDDAVVGTVTVTPTPEPTPAPQDSVSIEEITEDNGDNKKGDIIIHIPDKLEERLRDYLGVIGIDRVRNACAQDREINKRDTNGHRKRMPDLTKECEEAIGGASTNLLFTAGEDELGGLVPANQNNPMNPDAHPEGVAIPDINLEGVNMAVVVARRAFERGGRQPAPDNQRRHRMLMMAAIIINIINQAAREARDLQARLTLIRMSIDMIVRLTTKQIECSNELVCFSDNCQGYASVGPKITGEEDEELIQTGFCKKGETKGCQCEQVVEPTIRFFQTGYFDELEKFMKDLDDSVSRPTCDPSNGMSMDTARFDEAIYGACRDHQELRRRERHGASVAKRDTFEYENTDKDSLHWKLRWEDQGGQCSLKCNEVFERMLHDDKCRWWGGAAKNGSVPTECGQASYEVDFRIPDAQLEPRKCKGPFGQGLLGQDPAWSSYTGAIYMVDEFCNEKFQEKRSQLGDGENTYELEFWQVLEPSKWIVYHRYRMDRTGCPGQGPLRNVPANECVFALRKILDDCNGDHDDAVFGGTMVTRCIKYTALYDPDDPNWVPKTKWN